MRHYHDKGRLRRIVAPAAFPGGVGWWRWRDSNPQLPACKASTLAVELHPRLLRLFLPVASGLLRLKLSEGRSLFRARRDLDSRATYLMAADLSARVASSIAVRSGPGLRKARVKTLANCWLREADSNGRGLSPQGYEPCTLPSTLYPAFDSCDWCTSQVSSLALLLFRQALSPEQLEVC